MLTQLLPLINVKKILKMERVEPYQRHYNLVTIYYTIKFGKNAMTVIEKTSGRMHQLRLSSYYFHSRIVRGLKEIS